jgi:PAS domain S-box-containing protein
METRRATTRHRRGGSRSFTQLTRDGRADPGADRVIDAIRRPLVLLDEKLRVIFANRAFYRAFNIMPEETIGQHLAEIGDHRLDVTALRTFLGLVQAEDAAIEDYEIEIELPAVGRRVLLLSAEKIRREAEATREIVVMIDDVTERKRAETTLKSARWHAERANLRKSRFLAAARHDLRQPLQTLSLSLSRGES